MERTCRRWTAEEDRILVQALSVNPQNLQDGFREKLHRRLAEQEEQQKVTGIKEDSRKELQMESLKQAMPLLLYLGPR